MNFDEQYENRHALQSRINLHALYSQNKEPWQRWCFARLGLENDLDVLEVGCGTGALWSENRDRLPRLRTLVVSDASDAMVREATTRLKDLIPHHIGSVSRAEQLPFVSASFDLVIANHGRAVRLNRRRNLP